MILFFIPTKVGIFLINLIVFLKIPAYAGIQLNNSQYVTFTHHQIIGTI